MPAHPAADPAPPAADDAVARVLAELFSICEDALTLLTLDAAAQSPDLLRALAELRAETLAAFAFLSEV